MPAPLDPSIVRRSDIRGIYPEQINLDVARRIGKSLTSWLSSVLGRDEVTIAVGRDVRYSSGELFTGLTEGILEYSGKILDLDLVGTEIVNFAASNLDCDATVMISASHNPQQYNGMKFHLRGTVPLTPENGLTDIFRTAETITGERTHGSIEHIEIIDVWKKWLSQFIDKDKIQAFKVVIDAGNGMGGIMLESILPLLPIKVTKMYFEPDGAYPHHIPNPLVPKNLVDLCGEIQRQKADLGIAFDGDADRIVFIDELGVARSPSSTYALLARNLLNHNPGSGFVYNVVCGRVVPETIEKFGGKGYRTMTGHAVIKTKMRETDAIMGGEHSGHMYYRQSFTSDSSFLTLIKVLDLFSESGEKFSELLDPFTPYAQSGEINFETKIKDQIIETIRLEYLGDAAGFDLLDGVTMWLPGWWFNLRPSQNEDFLRLNIEADTKDILNLKSEELLSKIIGLGAVRFEE